MNRIPLLAIGISLTFAPAMLAQQPTSQLAEPPKGAAQGHSLPDVEDQLKVLTEKLNLTSAQQAKVRPIMQELHDATQKIMQDESMPQEERLSKIRPRRYAADKRIRAILNDDQKKKLDQYLQGPHPEMHGSLSGTPPPATGKPQL